MFSLNDADVHGNRCSILVNDRHTEYTDAIPKPGKGADCSAAALKEFVGEAPGEVSCYTDCSPEYKKSIKIKLGWIHPTSKPYDPKSNTVIETKVNYAKAGTRSTLERGGGDHEWWSYAMRHFLLHDNVRKKAWHKKWKKHFDGLKVPFMAQVSFTLPRKDQKLRPTFASKSVIGVFLGYYLGPGGVFDGQYYVARFCVEQRRDAARSPFLDVTG